MCYVFLYLAYHINTINNIKAIEKILKKGLTKMRKAGILTERLTEGMKKGAENAYLQVVQGNTAAKRLYASLGFTDFYTYWFRVQPEAVTQKGVS